MTWIVDRSRNTIFQFRRVVTFLFSHFLCNLLSDEAQARKITARVRIGCEERSVTSHVSGGCTSAPWRGRARYELFRKIGHRLSSSPAKPRSSPTVCDDSSTKFSSLISRCLSTASRPRFHHASFLQLLHRQRENATKRETSDFRFFKPCTLRTCTLFISTCRNFLLVLIERALRRHDHRLFHFFLLLEKLPAPRIIQASDHFLAIYRSIDTVRSTVKETPSVSFVPILFAA